MNTRIKCWKNKNLTAGVAHLLNRNRLIFWIVIKKKNNVHTKALFIRYNICVRIYARVPAVLIHLACCLFFFLFCTSKCSLHAPQWQFYLWLWMEGKRTIKNNEKRSLCWNMTSRLLNVADVPGFVSKSCVTRATCSPQYSGGDGKFIIFLILHPQRMSSYAYIMWTETVLLCTWSCAK